MHTSIRSKVSKLSHNFICGLQGLIVLSIMTKSKFYKLVKGCMMWNDDGFACRVCMHTLHLLHYQMRLAREIRCTLVFIVPKQKPSILGVLCFKPIPKYCNVWYEIFTYEPRERYRAIMALLFPFATMFSTFLVCIKTIVICKMLSI